MKGLSSRASLLALCLATFSFLACSTEQGRQPDTDENAGEGIRVGGGGKPVAGTGGSVVVERAVLSSAGDADLVHARIGYEGSWVWPRCALLEGPALEAVRETIDHREPPRTEGFTRGLWEESLWDDHESVWADRSTIEKSLQDDGGVIWIFHEDPAPDGKAADPRQTPFYVRCAGGDLPGTLYDVAHVSGTPTSILKPAPSPRRNL